MATKKHQINWCIEFNLRSFFASFNSGFLFLFLLNTWFFILFVFTKVADNAVFLTFSLKSFDSAFNRFCFANSNCRQIFHPLLFLFYLIIYKIFWYNVYRQTNFTRKAVIARIIYTVERCTIFVGPFNRKTVNFWRTYFFRTA